MNIAQIALLKSAPVEKLRIMMAIFKKSTFSNNGVYGIMKQRGGLVQNQRLNEFLKSKLGTLKGSSTATFSFQQQFR